MSWAGRRKALIIAIISVVALAFLSVVAIAVFYKAPSCTDGKQNQNEAGVDCGGTCAYLCTAGVTPPTIEFVRALSPEAGRYDVIAYISNPNPHAAAKGVAYAVDMYDANHRKIASRYGSVDLPAASTVPLYIPEAYRGSETITQTFLTFYDESFQWYVPQSEHVVPPVTNIAFLPGSMPRITATITNPLGTTLYSITPIAVAFDTDGNAIAASQTYLSDLSGQGTAQIQFTWNAPFASVPARVEVLPILPLRYP